jgi:predicted SAM-dependent methyltransferase
MPGFVGVDTRPFPWVKYVCDAWKIDKHVPPDSISEIYSRHFFEHLTFAQADLTFQAWNQILVPGGMLRIIVPDIEYHIKQFLTPNSLAPSETNPKWTVLEHALAGFWGWQNEGEEKFWDVHKSGYDFRCLEMKLLQHGFSDIRRIDDKPWNLNVICKTDIAKQMGENEL